MLERNIYVLNVLRFILVVKFTLSEGEDSLFHLISVNTALVLNSGIFPTEWYHLIIIDIY